MVGIVVVSHSHALAAAALALAREMAGPDVPVALAGGLDETAFGTDATRIAEAITAVDSPAGVVVLMDLGSAVLSADLALELLDPAVRDRVTLCPAPLVEGLVAATVTAAGGAPRAEVAAEATAALTAKQTQLATQDGRDPAAPTAAEPAAAVPGAGGDPAGPAAPGGARGAEAPGGADAPGGAGRAGASGGAATPGGPTSAGTPGGADGAGGAEAPGGAGRADAPGGAGASGSAGASGGQGGASGAGGADGAGGAEAVGEFVVGNPHGLHARPAARLVREVRGLGAEVTVRNLRSGAGPVPAGSLSRVATLGLRRGDRAEVRATGAGAEAAVAAILELAARRFDEPDEPDEAAAAPAAAAAAPAGRRGPLPVSPGIAIGPVWTLRAAPAEIPAGLPATGADPATERPRLAAAVGTARADIRAARDRAGGPAADILDAHLLLLDDPEVLADAGARIDAGTPAERAWAAALDTVASGLSNLDDAYFAERAADARTVRDQVLVVLLADRAGTRDTPGVAPAAASPAAGPRRSTYGDAPDGGGILVVADLTPAQAADLDAAVVRGLVLALAGPTAHSAILAAAKGIPTVAGAGAEILGVPAGTVVALDGGTGAVVVRPDEATLERFRRRGADERAAASAARAAAHRPAATADGVVVRVAANAASVAEARAAVAAGADLAGLVRTEFLFLDRAAAPDVDEQEAAYRGIAAALGGRRVTLRTLDVGGDKPLPYLPMPPEANPFLGVRGLRLALTRPALLRDQLTAMVRVARDHPVTILLPMVSGVAEVRAARAALDEVTGTGPRPDGLELGVMIEIPAAALKAAALAPYVDLFSIGTNDLTQYTLAAERGNAAVAPLADALDPAVLRLVDATCRAAPAGVTVAVCGEAAADPAAAPIFVGLGVRELSVAPAAIPRVKAAVRALTLPAARALAAAALAAPDAATVRALTPPAA
jgi:multiphosphoryl transfer protein